MTSIDTLNFNAGTPAILKTKKFGTNWPVVYIINNKKEAYIGETTDASIRSGQHLGNESRRRLNRISIIGNDKFNKSSILDLESFLIKYMSADETFQLQNGNGGLQNHNYYQKEMYESEFKNIWKQLKSIGLVKNDLRIIENSDLFKYSPYKSLTVDQYMIVNDILSVLAMDVKNNNKSTFVINGGAGTGKTVLGIYLMKLLSESKNDRIVIEDDKVEQNLNDIIKLCDAVDNLKIGLVIPMDNLRETLKKVFKNVKGLTPKMVLSPTDVAKSSYDYDLLIVDEAHRLRQRKNLTQYGSFDKNNDKFNLGKDGTELDWILLKSKYQIFFYDEHQSIKLTDVPKERFEQLKLLNNYHPYYLETQLRCMKGGNEYIGYIRELFSNKKPYKVVKFENYDFKLFNNVNDMVNKIKIKNSEFGLCRNIAGYSWKWTSKKENKDYEKQEMKKFKNLINSTYNDYKKKHIKGDNDSKVYEILNDLTQNYIEKNGADIEIQSYKYLWNTSNRNWINSPNSINEIGCIHTTQGFDLNYAGVIIGNELKYDPIKKEIYVKKNQYFDAKGKASTDDKQLLEYILNIYRTMCTRGILGTYLYICDDNLRNYFKEYIDEI